MGGGGCLGGWGGGSRWGDLGGGGGLHVPKAKRWSIKGSP